MTAEEVIGGWVLLVGICVSMTGAISSLLFPLAGVIVAAVGVCLVLFGYGVMARARRTDVGL